MKFAIWGTGVMGRIAFEFLGRKNISVFIDQNEKLQNKFYEGIPIINFINFMDSYTYKNDYVIVTPKDNAYIIDMLKQNGINSFSILQDILY